MYTTLVFAGMAVVMFVGDQGGLVFTYLVRFRGIDIVPIVYWQLLFFLILGFNTIDKYLTIIGRGWDKILWFASDKQINWLRQIIYLRDRMSRLLFVAIKTQLDKIAQEQTVIRRQLFAGHVVDS